MNWNPPRKRMNRPAQNTALQKRIIAIRSREPWMRLVIVLRTCLQRSQRRARAVRSGARSGSLMGSGIARLMSDFRALQHRLPWPGVETVASQLQEKVFQRAVVLSTFAQLGESAHGQHPAVVHDADPVG